MVSEKLSDLSLEYEIGKSVFIENREWIIAEIQTGLIKFQRERVDGTSSTMDISKNDLQKRVNESQYQFEN
jgi:hypothetical protein